MALQKPVAGQVIRYSYLWHTEQREGRDEGRKHRPCAIVAAVRADESGETHVLVLPITHSPPDDPNVSVEIPAKVKMRLRLDDVPSWIALSEWNEFVWPGPDLRRIPGATDASFCYGTLPPGLFAIVRDRFLAVVSSRRASRVLRS